MSTALVSTRLLRLAAELRGRARLRTFGLADRERRALVAHGYALAIEEFLEAEAARARRTPRHGRRT